MSLGKPGLQITSDHARQGPGQNSEKMGSVVEAWAARDWPGGLTTNQLSSPHSGLTLCGPAHEGK